MRITLFHKLFGAIFLTALVVVALLIATIQWVVQRNFAEYVSHVELERNEVLIEKLSNYYQDQKSWKSLRGKPRKWRELIRPQPPRSNGERPFFPRAQKEHHDSPLPPHMRDRLQKEMMRKNHARKQFIKRWEKHFSLYNAKKRFVIGSKKPSKDIIFREIKLGEKTVGWLGLNKVKNFSSPLQVSYIKKQSEILYLAGLGLLLLAALVSYLISRHLLARMKPLAAGTHAIADRKFEIRIPVKGTDEFGQLAKDFNRMAETLEAYEEERKQWFTDISHEMGTPLSVICGGFEALEDGVRELNFENLVPLRNEAYHMKNIVNDLRELSLAETGIFKLKKIFLDPLDILHDLIQCFQPRFEGQNIKIELELDEETPMMISGDPLRLKQLFSNLMENALRYVDQPGTLRLVYKAEGKKNLLICFEDSGPGVPEDSVSRLFERLYRVDRTRNRATGGSGLGLSICKYIVEAHRGSIRAQNVNGGLQIGITLPLASHDS